MTNGFLTDIVEDFKKVYRKHAPFLEGVPRKACLLDNIKAILFDMGGTLVNLEPSPETYGRILKAHGIEVPVEEIDFACERAKERLDFKRMPEIGASFWVKMNLLVLEHLGIKHNALPLAEALDREWWNYAGVSLYPEALTLLHKLKEKRVKIGLITNGFQTDMDKVLSKLNLTSFFDVEVNIDTVGKAKPDKEIFMYAVRKLGLQPKEVLFIGDHLDADYEGAINAGLKALLIDRDDKMSGEVEKVRSLHEILLLNI